MHQLGALPSVAVCSVLAAAAGLVCVLTRSSLGVWPVAAFLWTALAASNQLATRLSPAEDGTDWRVDGWVDGVPSASASRTVFSLRVHAHSAVLANARLRLSWYDPPTQIQPGDRIGLTVRLRHPRGYANPHAFDYERWLFLEGYAATGYVRSSHSGPVPDRSWKARILQFRWRLAQRVRDRVADDAAAAIITALTLGERSGVSEELWTVLRRSGTSHLVAISGLHITLISGFCFLTIGAIVRRLPYAVAARDLEIASSAAVIVGSGYAALAGLALPTQRAAIMVAFAAIVVLSRRRVGRLNGVAVAMMIVLAVDPLATLSASFWMSFAAVVVLLVCTLPRRVRAEPRRARLHERVVRAAGLQCQLTLALLPLSATFFGGVSLAAVPVNLVAIPVFCLGLIPLSLIAVLGLAVIPSFSRLIDVAGVVCGAAVDVLAYAAALPGALIDTTPASPVALAVAAVAVVLALPWHRSAGRSLVWLALLPLFFPRSAPAPARGEVDVMMLDVGHGLAIVLATKNHRLVYDAGPRFRSGFDAGAEIVVPTLRHEPARDVDVVVISHGDSDHSGGAAALLRAYPNATLLSGPDVDASSGRPCVAGERWQWDGVRFEIIHPGPDFAFRGNDSSCVLQVETATQSMLITGDIERQGEAALLRRGLTHVDVVVVPHHGSATSSSAGLVAATSPGLALVSAAYGNQWGFPVAEVRQRWREAGAQLYITGDTGAIGLRLGGKTPIMSLEREQQRRYWHAR